ncbi:hypothetical protein [Nostoc sp.]
MQNPEFRIQQSFSRGLGPALLYETLRERQSYLDCARHKSVTTTD